MDTLTPDNGMKKSLLFVCLAFTFLTTNAQTGYSWFKKDQVPQYAKLKQAGFDSYATNRGTEQNGYMPGYYARFVRGNEFVDCPTCNQLVIGEDDWDDYGHGYTVEHAIQQALALATGAPYVYLIPSDFISQN